MTSGDSGGNQAGAERGPSLGVIRRTEGLRGLAALGITNVWFLGGHDTAGQDPQRSLANWDHARALADAIRIVRITRPEVMLTWLPMQVAGENHGDHQAASVIANEAFDLAGDPTAFPEQVAAPTQTFEPLLEGLRPWQPKKIYFMSDAIDSSFMEGHGPSYSVRARSKADGRPYWETAYNQLRAHVTQYRAELERLAATDEAGREQMLTNAPPGDALIEPLRFIRGKSHVGGTPTGDVFESIGPGDVAFMPPPGYRAAKPSGVTISLGGPWSFYRRFWQAHGLDMLTSIDLHDVGPVSTGSDVRIPLLIGNRYRHRAAGVSKGHVTARLAREGAVLRVGDRAGERRRRVRVGADRGTINHGRCHQRLLRAGRRGSAGTPADSSRGGEARGKSAAAVNNAPTARGLGHHRVGLVSVCMWKSVVKT